MTDSCFNWEDADFDWNDNPYTWDDVCIVVGALDPKFDQWFNTWQKTKPEEKKRIVTLLTEIDGYTHVNEKDADNITLEISDVRLIAEDMKRYGIYIDVFDTEFKQ